MTETVPLPVNLEASTSANARETRAHNRRTQRLRRRRNTDSDTDLTLEPPRRRRRTSATTNTDTGTLRLVPCRSSVTTQASTSNNMPTAPGTSGNNRNSRQRRNRNNPTQAPSVIVPVPEGDLVEVVDDTLPDLDDFVVVLDDTLPDLDENPSTSNARDTGANNANNASTSSAGSRRQVVTINDNDSLIDLTSDDEIIVTLPSNVRNGNQSPVLNLTPLDLRSPARRARAVEDNSIDDDMPLVAVRTPALRDRNVSADNDVIVVEKENKHTPGAGSSLNDTDSQTPKRKMLSCPICLDHERCIRRTGRQMMSTTCGHIFCDDCIKKSISSMKCCPTCRKKLTQKTGIHPIFI